VVVRGGLGASGIGQANTNQNQSRGETFWICSLTGPTRGLRGQTRAKAQLDDHSAGKLLFPSPALIAPQRTRKICELTAMRRAHVHYFLR
jgi:hypothetical protein